MKKLSYFVFGFALIILIITLVVNFYYSKPLEEFVLLATVNITDRLGFDVNGSELSFGKVMPGGSSSRIVTFTNGYSFPVLVKMTSEGTIKDLLSYPEIVYVESGEKKRIGFSVFAEETPEGYYEGEVKFEVTSTSRIKDIFG